MQGAQKHSWALVSTWLILVVCITSYLSLWISSLWLNLYLVQPALWLSVAGLSFWAWRRESGEQRPELDRWTVGMAVLVGLFHVSVLLFSGVLVGFGRSPYAHQLLLVVLNLWFVSTRLLGLELARWFLVSTFRTRKTVLGASLAWFILSLASLPLVRIVTMDYGSTEEVFRLAGNTILPVISQNILATYLVMVGGPFAALAYRGTLAGFEWISPLLPNLPWILNAFLGTITPVLGVLFVRELVEWRAQRDDSRPARGESLGSGWILASVIVVFVLWFNSGLFGVKPTLINGISMEPNLRTGDIVITRNIPANEVKIGDVVSFKEGKNIILHRVVSIQEGGDGRIFITKGDNVQVLDRPWAEGQLQGKLVLVIPKVGWISIGMKMLVNRAFASEG